jgi:quercetin dioxygenase-like cupin family protein
MATIKHPIPEALRAIAVEDLLEKQVVRFSELEADWDAFADSRTEGGRRGQYRMIGGGGSGKADPKAIAPGGFTFSIMCVPPGNGGALHTHEVEEAFFCLMGRLTVFMERDGKLASTVLMPWDIVSCPAGIPHGFRNDGTEDVYMQTMIGTGKPGPVGYVDDSIYAEEERRRKLAATR